MPFPQQFPFPFFGIPMNFPSQRITCWTGVYASAAALPGVASAEINLRVNDQAFVTGKGVYQCTSAVFPATWVPAGGSGIVGPSNAVYVDIAGDDATGERGNAALPFASIEAALAVTQDGDEVLIGPGVFVPTVVLSPPVGVRNLKIQGSGTTLNPIGVGGGSGVGGTVIDNSTVGAGTILDFSSIMDTLTLADFATQGDINLDGSTSAGLFLAFGFFVNNIIVRNVVALDVVAFSWTGGSIDGATITTCSDVLFSDTTITTGVDVVWDNTDANKPSAGRSGGVVLRACTTGGATLGGQGKLYCDPGTTLNSVQGGGTALSVSGGLAPSLRVTGLLTGSAGIAIDFDTAGKRLPDSATACLMDFDGVTVESSPVKFSVAGAPPVNRQIVSMRNATVATSAITAGSAIDIGLNGATLGSTVTVTTSGTPTGTTNNPALAQTNPPPSAAATGNVTIDAIPKPFYQMGPTANPRVFDYTAVTVDWSTTNIIKTTTSANGIQLIANAAWTIFPTGAINTALVLAESTTNSVTANHIWTLVIDRVNKIVYVTPTV